MVFQHFRAGGHRRNRKTKAWLEKTEVMIGYLSLSLMKPRFRKRARECSNTARKAVQPPCLGEGRDPFSW